MPIKHAFQGLRGTWFLYIEARNLNVLDKPGLSKCVDTEGQNLISNVSNITDSLITTTERDGMRSSGKERRIKGSRGVKRPQELPKTLPLSKKKKNKKDKVNNFLGYEAHESENGCPINEEIAGVTTKENFGFFASKNEVESAVKWNSSPMVETPNETPSEIISAAGIIYRCTSSFSEVSGSSSSPRTEVASTAVQSQLKDHLGAKRDDNCSNIQVDALLQPSVGTPSRTLPFSSSSDRRRGTARNKPKRTEVGKRLVMASKNLRMSANKQRSAVSFSRYKYQKLLSPNTLSLAKYLAFEITDD